MSRSGYSNDLTSWELNLYRANVHRAIKGKAGQAFLAELLEGLDAMPEKRLIRDDLELTPEGVARGREAHTWYAPENELEFGVCAIGVVGKARGLALEDLDAGNADAIGKMFGIARCMAAEIECLNDELSRPCETPEERFGRVRKWVVSMLGSGSP